MRDYYKGRLSAMEMRMGSFSDGFSVLTYCTGSPVFSQSRRILVYWFPSLLSSLDLF